MSIYKSISYRSLSFLLCLILTVSVCCGMTVHTVYADEYSPVTSSEEVLQDDADDRSYIAFKAARLDLEPAVREELYESDEEPVEEMQIGKAYPDPDSNMGIIYRYITEEMGLNRAVAFGILAHMRRESTFLPTAYNPAGYYGLCQWGGNRYTNLINWCTENGYDYTTIDGQVRFMDHELHGAYSKVLETLENCENTADGAYEAAYAFGMRYEVSGIDLARSAGSSAMSMFNRTS